MESCKNDVDAAVYLLATNRHMRLDQLHALGVTEDELHDALSKKGYEWSTKYYGGIFGDENPFEDPDPSSVYIDLVRRE